MKPFRTYELAKSFYQECSNLQFHGAMKNQFERALLSVVLNVSEGSGRATKKDRSHFYFISYASLKETRTMLDLGNYHQHLGQADILGAHLWKLAKNPGGS